MYTLYPYFTNDGSVGLYSPEADDIYHTTYGAITESYEKFIQPLNLKKYFEKNYKIKILDICFGIGYNTKIFLKNLIENVYIGKLYSDNIRYNDKICSDNILPEIFIHAIDNDKILTTLSPFFKIGSLEEVKNQNLLFDNKKIKERICELNTDDIIKEIDKKLIKCINIILLGKIANRINDDTISVLNNDKYSRFFDADICHLLSSINSQPSVTYPNIDLNAFLHNIYYKNISDSVKKALKALYNNKLTFKLSNEDARVAIRNDNMRYNLVFLDAFSPDKCPMLWTYDFLKCIYEHMEDNGVLLTYTSSARVRKALIDIGFDIYKTYSVSQDKFCGTVAVKSKTNNKIKCNFPSPLAQSEIEDLNKCNFSSPLAGEGRVRGATSDELLPISSEPEGRVRGAIPLNNDIIYPLSEYELNLLNTKAGIYYRDNNLNLTNEEILQNHKTDVEKSKLMSTTQYKKLSEYNE